MLQDSVQTIDQETQDFLRNLVDQAHGETMPDVLKEKMMTDLWVLYVSHIDRELQKLLSADALERYESMQDDEYSIIDYASQELTEYERALPEINASFEAEYLRTVAK